MLQESYFTGDEDEDAEVLQMVQQLLDVLKFVFLFVERHCSCLLVVVVTAKSKSNRRLFFSELYMS